MSLSLGMVLSEDMSKTVDACSGRKRISVLENMLGHTLSGTITVLNS